MKDNPYTANKYAKGHRGLVNTQELQDWRDKIKSRQKRLKIIIYGLLISLIVVIALIVATL